MQSNNIHLKLRNINWSICLQLEISELTTNHTTREIFWRDALSICIFTSSDWIYLHLLLYFTSKWTRGILTETACFKLILDMFSKIWPECVNRNIQNETGGKTIPCDTIIPNNTKVFYFENNTWARIFCGGFRNSFSTQLKAEEFALYSTMQLIELLKTSSSPTFYQVENMQNIVGSEMIHLSASVFQVLPGYENIYFAHSSWFTYAATLRIYKHWNFNIVDPYTSTSRVSFSSYPGKVKKTETMQIFNLAWTILLNYSCLVCKKGW